MSLRTLWRGGLLLRTIARGLDRLASELHEQNVLLRRLADHFAPAAVKYDQESVQDSGVSFLDAIDAGLAQEFAARSERDTGHTPTDEELLTYLADEKTHDLHLRLKAREVELAQRHTSKRGEP